MTNKSGEVHIRYSQNGRIISDEIFRTVDSERYYSAAFYRDRHAALIACKKLAKQYGCGMAESYVTWGNGSIEFLNSAYGMDFRQSEPEFDRINHGPFEHPVSE